MLSSIKLEDIPRDCLIAVLQNVGVRDWTSLANASKFFRELIQVRILGCIIGVA